MCGVALGPTKTWHKHLIKISSVILTSLTWIRPHKYHLFLYLKYRLFFNNLKKKKKEKKLLQTVDIDYKRPHACRRAGLNLQRFYLATGKGTWLLWVANVSTQRANWYVFASLLLRHWTSFISCVYVLVAFAAFFIIWQVYGLLWCTYRTRTLSFFWGEWNSNI